MSGAELEGAPRAISVHYDGPEVLELSCDTELLHRALENIIRNALRFSPDGGRITLKVTVIGCDLQISISDQGAGVIPERLPYLFNAFLRGEEGDGFGLGLAIAAQAVRLHDGRLRAENLAPAGFRIWIEIPRF